jgi:serine/threonine protein kinase/Tol biopolymer transport system component
MALAPGTRLGPYEIGVPLGAGGMGEVYRARDTRLDRQVAIKILPSHLSTDPVRKQRFEREAKTISSLNHPNICVLHDVGEQDGTDYLVMECIEGETLSKRLERGQLPLEQVLKYGEQIADALDRAHRSGVIHRDLKPGNIMLTKSGVKLLDFGLAKPVVEAFVNGQTLSQSPGTAGPLTAEGAILGTMQYMSPEQLEGKETDARSDVYSYGTVLYEMATGMPAFRGKSQASVIAAIMDREPALISATQPMSPPALDALVKTCLEKDANERWQSIHDVKLQLKSIAIGESASAASTAGMSKLGGLERWLWMAGLLTLLASGSTLYFRKGSGEVAGEAIWANVLAPEHTVYSYFAGPVTVSPDGKELAFVAASDKGKETIWVRPLDSPNAVELAGTEGASYPFWSPDSRTLGFFSGGKLKRIDAAGGPILTICEAAGTRGATWNKQGTILFSGTWTPVFKVSASGGAPVAVTNPSQLAMSHRWPHFLPDGKHFLYLQANFASGSAEAASIYVGSLDSKESKLLFNARSNVAYFDGYLLYLRERTLLAQPFDLGKLELTGDSFPIAENVQFSDFVWGGVFSVSPTGVLAYQGGATPANSQLLVYDRKGTRVGQVGEPADYGTVRYSPDGQRVVADVLDYSAGNYQLGVWSHNNWTKLTFNVSRTTYPVWSPDGNRVVYSANPRGPYDIFMRASNGTGKEEKLYENDASKMTTSWSPDGKFIAYNVLSDDKRRVEIWMLPMVGEHKPYPFLQAAYNIGQGRFSSDGRWLAYVTDESGRANVYVTPFPDGKGKWQISADGGSMVRWRKDGKELYYLNATGDLMAVEVTGSGQEFSVGRPRILFHMELKTGPSRYDLSSTSEQIGYDASPDGQRFIVTAPVEGSASPVTLVTNWKPMRKGGPGH